MALDKAFNEVQQLVKKFTDNLTHYMSPGYSEAEARQDFIDDFFIALGWDVLHREQTNPYQQEVKIERSQKQQNETARKRADYAFFTAPNFKDEVFFCEAKKPSVLIEKNEQHYFQTIKYGWNSGCPICVLTDFEEFVIIDCRSKPEIKYALNGKHKTYRYNDYANKEKFAEIYWLFSREAVANNSLAKYAAGLQKPKGKVVQKQLFKGSYQAIDDSFLEYIDGIRENIAKAFKKANEDLNSEQLTEATQRTVDRLVFIRFLEDKFIEAAEHVSEWASWKNFISDCRKLDAKYNGVVFKKHFIDEPHFLGADEKLFLDICSDISNLNSPYDFNYIPIHILGSIYERFLGKIVIATDKRVRIEEKPEVRKAGGVYYTPKYIVDYIVKNTVGKIIEGLTPQQIAGKASSPLERAGGEVPLTFADIACGSGSFLIGVYDYLLDYHKKYYTQKLQGKTEIDKRSEDYGNAEYKDGLWVLSLKLKQQILLNNIYGVDIDAQAVEVTQLSLFLKMLDEENVSSTTTKQGALFSKVLPDLSKNIVCGNSLIGFDIMNGQLFEDDELKKLNPMDYETAFAKIMRGGGFDAVVGNPPYVTEIFSKQEVDYFNKAYSETLTGKPNLYRLFVHKVIKVLNKDGLLGYIIPNTYLTSRDSINFRKYLLENITLKEILFFPESLKVFKGVTQATTVLLLSKGEIKSKSPLKAFFHILNTEHLSENKFEEYNQNDFKRIDGNLFLISRNKKQFDLILKLLKRHKKIEHYYDVFQGEVNVSTYKDIIYADKKNNSCLPLIRGNNIGRYSIDLNFNDIKGSWVNCAKNKFREHYKAKRVVTQEVSNMQQSRRLNGMPLNSGILAGHTANYLIPHNGNSIEFLIGLLNSYLLDFIFQTFNSTNHIPAGEIKKLPIPEITQSNKQQHDKLVTLVTQMLEVKKQLATAITDSDKNFLHNKCSSIDRQIDNLVYALYGLTEQEIKIVEGG